MRYRWSAWLVSLSAAGVLAPSCVVVEEDAPLYDRVAYAACHDDWECPVGMGCYEVWVDYDEGLIVERMCTQRCEWDFDCLHGAICVDAQWGPALCYQLCSYDAECQPGFACVADMWAAAATCLPE